MTRLEAGNDWRLDIGTGLLSSKMVMFIGSRASVVSDWCIKELHMAKKHGLVVSWSNSKFNDIVSVTGLDYSNLVPEGRLRLRSQVSYFRKRIFGFLQSKVFHCSWRQARKEAQVRLATC